MKIELKRLSVNQRLSEETHNFVADLWVDGRKIGQISNGGYGGPDEFHGDQAAYDRADAWCKANLPRWSSASLVGDDLAQRLEEAGNTKADDTFETDLEMHVADLINEHVSAKALRAKLAKAVLFTKPNEKGLWQITLKKGAPAGTLMKTAQVQATHPGFRVLNLLPFDEALAIFRAN